MISHRKCEKVAEQRALTRKFKAHVYGPWLRYDPEPAGKGLRVKSHYSQSLTYEETLTYARFMVEVRVDVVYASEHEWGGKKLIRSLLQTFEVDKISPLARLTAEDKASIVHGLMDHLMKQREAWSKQRWVPLLVLVKVLS
ncbi:hypothetical protein ARALYDRAFT_315905 [Arabidopsis lyrata subsp. lyrata]|uniref:Uncharacterized protein n=1 Tax=Arabidopsis lyrata subsp. lyrata TaxID=81972 RepID=D7KWV5_ARALL|nr:hypothetical protein ARALYDRAFT_315905 [Arabidopsis lyrata subsp. lyrata]